MSVGRIILKRFLQFYGAISLSMFLFGFIVAIRTGLQI